VGAAYLGLATRPALAWSIDWSAFRRLMVTGLPVSLLPIGFTLFQSVDRWIVASVVPASALGFYGLGAVLGLFLYMIPNTLAVVLFSKQIERFGATGDARASASLVSPPLLASGYFMAFVAGAATLTIPVIIFYLVPAYVPGTRVAMLQVTGNCLLFAVPVASSFLISAGVQRHVFLGLTVAVVVEAALVSVLVRTPWGIDGAALAVLLSDAVYGGVLAWLAVRMLGGTAAHRIRRVALCFLPFGICLPVAWLVSPGRALGLGVGPDVWTVAGRTVAYAAICGPICLVSARSSGLLREPFVAARVRRVYDGRLIGVLLGEGKHFHD
jgi:O-antigen/teichoic acid export membrane protein